MKEKLTKNSGLKLISLLCAFFVWLAVVNVANPVTTDTKEVPVEPINEQVLEKADLTYDIVGKKTAVITYLTSDGNYRLSTSNGGGGAVTERLRIDTGGNLYAAGGVHDMGQRVYSPNNPPHNSHNHTAAQGNSDIVAGSYGQVGTYALASNVTGVTKTIGTTVAGSSLVPASAGDRHQDGTTLPGTWKCLGYSFGTGGNFDARITLWIRIA